MAQSARQSLDDFGKSGPVSARCGTLSRRRRPPRWASESWERERNLTQIMSPQELEEAERQAAGRLKKLRGQSPSTGIDPMPNQKKLTGVPIEEFA